MPVDDVAEERFDLTEWALDNGYAGFATLGYEKGSFGFELEGSYRKMDGDFRLTKSSRTRTNITGDQSMISCMTNVFVIFMPEKDISTYLGGGVGMTQVSWNNIQVSGGSRIDDSEWVLSWQAIAGVSFDLSSRVSLEVDYRYLKPSETDLTDSLSTENSFDDLHTHNVMVGFKFRF